MKRKIQHNKNNNKHNNNNKIKTKNNNTNKKLQKKKYEANEKDTSIVENRMAFDIIDKTPFFETLPIEKSQFESLLPLDTIMMSDLEF